MLQKIRDFLLSPYFAVLIFVLSVAAYLLGDTAIIVCVIIEIQLVALALCLSDDLAPTLLPILSVVVLGTTLIGKLQIITPYIPYAFTVIPAAVFHLIAYRRPVRIGISFYGLLATAAAILLSGIGNLDTVDYTSPTVLYYTLGMSVGLLLLYLLLSAEIKREVKYDRIEYLLEVLCYVGGLCAVVIVYHLVTWLSGYGDGASVHDYYALMPYRNTIANILILCLPAPFYFAGYGAKRNATRTLMFLVGCFFYSAMLMTVARTAMLFGTALLVCCLVYYFRGKGNRYFKAASILVAVVGVSVVGISFYGPLMELFSSRLEEGLASVGEARWFLLLRSLEDFLSHPIFGIGFGSSQNADIYAAEGCISWYHLYFPQIWGGLGLVGCVAFGYQLFIRARLALFRPNCKTVALVLSYLGIFLYSQTDPGEFIPIPFAALAVLIFVLLEDHAERVRSEEGSGSAENGSQ